MREICFILSIIARSIKALLVYRHFHGEGDYSQAGELLLRVAGNIEEREAYFRLIEIRAKNFTLNPAKWLQIQALTEELLLRNELSQKEIKNLLTKPIF